MTQNGTLEGGKGQEYLDKILSRLEDGCILFSKHGIIQVVKPERSHANILLKIQDNAVVMVEQTTKEKY